MGSGYFRLLVIDAKVAKKKKIDKQSRQEDLRSSDRFPKIKCIICIPIETSSFVMRILASWYITFAGQDIYLMSQLVPHRWCLRERKAFGTPILHAG